MFPTAILRRPIKQSELYRAVLNALSKTPQAKPDVPPAAASYLTLPSVPKSNGKLILVAEDNHVNQKIAARMLETLGFACDVVANGKEALESIRTVPYAAILMDCQMPEMDGFESTSLIRTLPGQRGHIPIVAMTAYAMKSDQERCLAAGMDACLLKPIRLESLAQILAHHLDHQLGSFPPRDFVYPTEATAPRLDHTMLRNWRELSRPGEQDFLTEIIDVFLETAPPVLEDIRRAQEQDQSADIRRLAHKLKGSSANLGARRLAELCRLLDAEAGYAASAGVTQLIQKIRTEYELVKTELTRSWRH